MGSFWIVLASFVLIMVNTNDEFGEFELTANVAKFEFRGLADECLGRVFYELDGKRFVYQFNENIGRPNNPVVFFLGFDGCEYWIARFDYVKTDKQTYPSKAVAMFRATSLEQLNPEHAREIQSYFRLPGQSSASVTQTLARLAHLENIRNSLHISKASFSDVSFYKSITEHDGWKLANIGVESTDENERFLQRFEFSNGTEVGIGQVKVDEAFGWKYAIQFSKSSPATIERIEVQSELKGFFKTGPEEVPPFPLPTRFRLLRMINQKVPVVIFMPQLYMNENTKTFRDK